MRRKTKSQKINNEKRHSKIDNRSREYRKIFFLVCGFGNASMYM